MPMAVAAQLHAPDPRRRPPHGYGHRPAAGHRQHGAWRQGADEGIVGHHHHERVGVCLRRPAERVRAGHRKRHTGKQGSVQPQQHRRMGATILYESGLLAEKHRKHRQHPVGTRGGWKGVSPARFLRRTSRQRHESEDVELHEVHQLRQPVALLRPAALPSRRHPRPKHRPQCRTEPQHGAAMRGADGR